MTNRTSGIEPHQHPGLSKTFVEEKLSPVVLRGQGPTICLVEPFGAGTFSRAEGRNGVTGLPQSFASEWHERLTDAQSFVARSDEQRPNPTVSHIARRKSLDRIVLFPNPNLRTLDEVRAVFGGR